MHRKTELMSFQKSSVSILPFKEEQKKLCSHTGKFKGDAKKMTITKTARELCR